MTELEQKIRDSLRRADDMVVPVAPIDPDEIATNTRPRTASGGPGRSGLAVAAVIALVAAAGFGSWNWLGRDGGVPATPAAPAATAASAVPASAGGVVEVDVYSGRENPRVTVDGSVTRQLYAMLADQQAVGALHETGAPDFGLGFRGFVLTPTDGSLPALRILQQRVILARGGGYQQLQDPDMIFYNRVYDAVRPHLDADVRDALPDSNPAIPHVTATVPPTIGTAATWTLANPKGIDQTSTTLKLKVTRAECASGKTGKLLPPVVSLGTADIVIRVDAAPLTKGAQTCQGNDAVSVTVTLPEPVGDRSLVDAACLEGHAVRSRDCAEGGTRWVP